MPKLKQRYCSLDIETSGFDPLTCEILEVGFAFFELTPDGVKITEEFTQVFKPAKEVPASIFGLTGITQEELDDAPSFASFKEIIQEKIGDAIIVGHNIIFDINFLQSFGIKFSGKSVDTLDLVQFILPTHHSYNLENLMHVFRVAHKEAHRALADAKATLVVLEKMLRLYQGFPVILKKQVAALIKPFRFPWEALLSINLSPIIFSPPAKPKPIAGDYKNLVFEAKKVYDFGLSDNYLQQAVAALKGQAAKALLAVPKESAVMELWKEGLVEGLFGADVLFNEEKFGAFLQKPEKSEEEVKFLLKVLVWKHTNWQHKCLLDLNLSFFGGQFRQQIAGGGEQEQIKPKLLCCSHETFSELADKGRYKDRLVIIEGLAELEQYLSSGIAAKVSWGFVAYLLKSYYNPELNTGNEKLKPQVLEMLERTDLFFGLAGAFFQDGQAKFLYIKVTEDLVRAEKFQKLAKAAANYAEKLETFAKSVKSLQLEKAAKDLNGFFDLQPGKVHWMELGDKRCSFHSALLDIAPLVNGILSKFAKIAFVDSLGSAKIFSYYSTRLGVKDFERKLVALNTANPAPALKSVQGDLFHKLVEPVFKDNSSIPVAVAKKSQVILTAAKPKIVTYHCLTKPLINEDLEKLVLNSVLPTAVLFGNATQVRDFYDKSYQKLQAKARVLVNTHSGGSNKLFHNFFIDQDNVMLVTDKFILKYLGSAVGSEPVKRLPVKTLIVGHLPFEQFTHPYQEALASGLANAFLDYSLPKAIYNLHRLLRFFNTPALENVYMWDNKLAKGYGRDFIEYLQGLNGAEVVEEY